MADEFRRGLDCECDMGVHCPFCSTFNRGKAQKRGLRKIVRARLKRKDLTEFKEYGITKEEE